MVNKYLFVVWLLVRERFFVGLLLLGLFALFRVEFVALAELAFKLSVVLKECVTAFAGSV